MKKFKYYLKDYSAGDTFADMKKKAHFILKIDETAEGIVCWEDIIIKRYDITRKIDKIIVKETYNYYKEYQIQINKKQLKLWQ